MLGLKTGKVSLQHHEAIRQGIGQALLFKHTQGNQLDFLQRAAAAFLQCNESRFGQVKIQPMAIGLKIKPRLRR